MIFRIIKREERKNILTILSVFRHKSLKGFSKRKNRYKKNFYTFSLTNKNINNYANYY